jgi:ubiquitin related modifier 1
MKLTVEFSGGLQLLFDQNPITLAIEDATLSLVISHLSTLCKNNDLFIKNNTLRPGILCLRNDMDSELVGEELSDGDRITFISTLHGG